MRTAKMSFQEKPLPRRRGLRRLLAQTQDTNDAALLQTENGVVILELHSRIDFFCLSPKCLDGTASSTDKSRICCVFPPCLSPICVGANVFRLREKVFRLREQSFFSSRGHKKKRFGPPLGEAAPPAGAGVWGWPPPRASEAPARVSREDLFFGPPPGEMAPPAGAGVWGLAPTEGKRSTSPSKRKDLSSTAT